jgi:Concanavalin A-like lectin/glucanases superfamily
MYSWVPSKSLWQPWRTPPYGSPANLRDSQATGLVEAFAFNERSGTKVYGATGNPANYGALSSSTWGEGFTGSAWSGNGSSNFINLGSAIPLTGQMTVAMLISPATVATGLMVIAGNSNSAGTAEPWWVEINRTAGKLGFGWDATLIVTGNDSLTANVPTSCVWTRTGTTSNWNANIYVNGQFDNGGTSTLKNPSTNQTTAIGRYGANTSFYYSGLIHVAYFSNRPWTTEEKVRFYKEPYWLWQAPGSKARRASTAGSASPGPDYSESCVTAGGVQTSGLVGLTPAFSVGTAVMGSSVW